MKLEILPPSLLEIENDDFEKTIDEVLVGRLKIDEDDKPA